MNRYPGTRGRKVDLPEWAQWKGEGPPPPKWTAINPLTNKSVIVYRSYADYVDD